MGTAWAGIDVARAQIRAIDEQISAAQQAYNGVREEATLGARTTLDVLNAEQQKTLALRDLAQARYLYLVSRLRLQSLAGEDRQAIVAEINAWLVP